MPFASRGPVRWEWLAVSGLVCAAVLLLRNTPLPIWWLLPVALLWPFAGRFRWTLLLAVALGSWMAWQYSQAFEARLKPGRETVTLQGQVRGAVKGDAGNRRFDLIPADTRYGPLRVAWYRDAPDLLAGQCWELSLRLRPPRGALNPGGLDYEAWLFREGIAGLATVKSGRLCAAAAEAGSAVPHWRQRWHQHLLGRGYPRAAATMEALLLGDRTGLNDQDWTVLRRTGSSHLFAISGLHVGLVAGLAYALGILLWRLALYRFLPRAVDCGAVLAALAALAYAAVSGFALPVQRALIMALLGLLAVVSGRQRQALSIWALAMVMVLACDPLAVMSPGFWLSFIAVLGILWYLHHFPKQHHISQLIGIQLLLTVLLMPLSLYFFGGVSWLSFAVNLILIPLFGLILPGLLLLCGMHLAFAWNAPLDWALWGLDKLWKILDALAQWSWAYKDYVQPSLAMVVLSVIGVLVLLPCVWWLRVSCMLAVIACLLHVGDRPAQGDFRLWVWDVGQGQSVLIQTAQHNLLYDAGPAWPGGFDAGERLVVPALRSLGIDALDKLIVSHSDKDHAGGVAAVIRNLIVRDHLGSGGRPCVAGQSWTYDGVSFFVLHPANSQGSDNNQSCVLRIEATSKQAALLTGDIEALAERQLLDQPRTSLSADLILVPHHGSNTSSTREFLQAVAPRWAIASAGFSNRWGFPSRPVRARYAQLGIPLWVSGERGAIRVDIGKTLQVQALREAEPRLWRYSVSTQ